MAVDPLAYKRDMREVLRAYRDAEQYLTAQVQRMAASGLLTQAGARRNLLFQVQSRMQMLGSETDSIAAEAIRRAWFDNADRAIEQINAAGVSTGLGPDFVTISQSAVEQLEQSIVASLTDARVTVGRRIADDIAREGRRQALANMLGAPGSTQGAAKNLAQTLRDKGIKAFTDKAGRQWTLENYSKMAMRTTTREAAVQGSLASMTSTGVTVARIADHVGACPICQPWLGKLVSIDGNTSELRGEPVATADVLPGLIGWPPFHPNCECIVVPEVASMKDLRQELAL